jgi:hypothetical protein
VFERGTLRSCRFSSKPRSSGDLLSVPVVDEADTLGPTTSSDVADRLWTAVAEREEAEEQADRDDEDR